MKKAAIFVSFALLGVLAGSGSYFFGLFSGLDRFLEDRLFLARPHDERIMILAVDEAALSVFGQWPWPRAAFAEVIKGLNELNPAAIALDISFADPSRHGSEDDAALARAIRESKVPIILAAEAAPLDLTGYPAANHSVTPLSSLSNSALLGYTNVIADPDGVVRRFPPLIQSKSGIEKHFAVRVAEALDADITFPDKALLRINYAGGPGTFHTASLALKTENGEAYKAFTEGKVIIIGATAQSLQDFKPVPTGNGRNMAGAEIHAHIADTILQGKYLLPISKTFGFAAILLLSLIPAIAFLYISRSLMPILVSLGSGAAYLAAALMGYDSGAVLPIVPVFLGWLVSGSASLSYRSFAEEREKRKIRETFSKYVSKEVLDIILTANEPQMLMGRKTEATILFTDLQGFTKASSNLPPERVIEFLNIYFETMSPIIKSCRGIVDKFIGDAIMAFWCEPFAGGKFADRAVYCAFEMLEAVPKVNVILKERGLPELIMRIGINTGEIVVGNIGSSDRLDFTVIGNAVNAAARLEPLNKEYGTSLMVSEATYRTLTESYPLAPLGTAELRGTTGATVIYGYPKSGVFAEKPTADTKNPTRPEEK